MTKVDNTSNVDLREIRKFSRVMAIAFPVIFGLLLPWVWDLEMRSWPWITSIILLLTGQFATSLLVWPYRLWFKLAEALGWFNTRVILGIVFFTLFTPIAIFLKILNKCPLDQKGTLQNDSYRIVTQQRNDNHFEKPF